MGRAGATTWLVAAVVAGIGLAGAAPAAAQSSSAGTSDLRIGVGYGCRTSGTGPADWRTTAHIFTTVTNTGSAPVRDVVARVQVLAGFGTANRVAALAPGESVTFDNDTLANALVLTPVGAFVSASGIDANPLDNAYVGLAPFVCSAL